MRRKKLGHKDLKRASSQKLIARAGAKGRFHLLRDHRLRLRGWLRVVVPPAAKFHELKIGERIVLCNGAEAALLLDELRDQAGPTGLMACAKPGAAVAMKIFVE